METVIISYINYVHGIFDKLALNFVTLNKTYVLVFKVLT